ncbi:MAG: hypothetical protein ACE5QF_09905, partial [Thermoplasmata archaeon]
LVMPPPGWRLRHHLRKLCLEEVERRANEIQRKITQALLSPKARLYLAEAEMFLGSSISLFTLSDSDPAGFSLHREARQSIFRASRVSI